MAQTTLPLMIKIRSFATILILLLHMAFCFNSHAQQTTDIGLILGSANYWGDIQGINLSKNATPISGVLIRTNINSHSAFRIQMLSGELKGNSILDHALIGQPLNGALIFANNQKYDYNFKRFFKNIELVYEYNFLNYKLGHQNKMNFTPFVGIGLGLFYSSAPKNGSFILEPDPSTVVRTPIGPPFIYFPPYISSNGHRTNDAAILTCTVPISAGFKINITERLNVVTEIMIHPTLSDNIDNLKDPQRFQNPSATQVGYIPPKFSLLKCDKYGTILISVSYQIYSTERHKIKIWNRPRRI